MVPAGLVKAGDRVWVADELGPVEVESVSAKGAEDVVWVLVEGEQLVVNGIIASVWSSAAKALETLPFRFLHAIAPPLLQVGLPS